MLLFEVTSWSLLEERKREAQVMLNEVKHHAFVEPEL